MVTISPAIIVHGGAGAIPAEEHAAYQAGCRAAALAGFDVLRRGGSALDAIEAAIVYLEDDPTFDAGVGSYLNRDGVVQLDAGIMDGRTYQVGAVIAIERVKNPIRVARRLLAGEHTVFAGPGATAYAQASGIPLCDPEDLVTASERELWRLECSRLKVSPGTSGVPGKQGKQGTVGAVAMDRTGTIVAGTSTGGSKFKPAGRVGDSPLPGCGYYADNALAGVSSTGHGESIMRVLLARSAADLCARLEAPQAAQAAIRLLDERVGGQAGLIMIDHAGRVGYAHSTPAMARAFMLEGMDEPEAGI
jgi:beta-aspartyl-peptidase (threonine type)